MIRTLTHRRRWLIAGLAALSAVSLTAIACGDDGAATPTANATTAVASKTTAASGTAATSAPTTPAAATIAANVGKDDKASLTGAGATFPAPIYQAWFDDYNKNVAKGVQINYQAVGSGGGIQQFTAKTVDFGASDVGMTDAQIATAGDVQLLPTVIGAVVVTYNLSGVTAPLKLDGPTVANIYLGVIKKWNDPAIAALNPGVTLPGNDIQVVYRSDSSGTSGVFTDYLSKVSADWKGKVGANTAPSWPTGQGAKGNDGVTGVVKNTPNGIGYVELNYAVANKLPFADMKNKAGKYVSPSIDSASAAAAGVTVPADYRVSITEGDGDATYPIASFTYMLLFKTNAACAQQAPLVNFLWWAYHDASAQKTIKELNYSPLPTKLLPSIETTLKGLKCDNGAKSSLKTTG